MIQFYKRVAALLLVGCLLILFMSWLCLSRFFVNIPLLPENDSKLPWAPRAITDHQSGGGSSLTVNSSNEVLDYDFLLTEDIRFPYASLAIDFENEDAYGGLVNLSKYTTIQYEVSCEPNNVLALVLYAYDETVPKSSTSGSHRIPTRYFSCGSHWSLVEINLHDLELPEWWLRMNELSLSEQGYRLDRVTSIAFAISLQSPINTNSNVKIRNLSLNGYDYRYLYFLIYSVLMTLAVGLIFLVRGYRRAIVEDVRAKILRDRPLLSYQKLTISSRKNRDVEELLKFLAKEYSNPDLKLELVASQVGINRTKINELLNSELGLSFSAYVNKLRLTEASRLLLDKENNASITEICHHVGYNNVSYFSALFKKEYGCSPKAFKSLEHLDRQYPPPSED